MLPSASPRLAPLEGATAGRVSQHLQHCALNATAYAATHPHQGACPLYHTSHPFEPAASSPCARSSCGRGCAWRDEAYSTDALNEESQLSGRRVSSPHTPSSFSPHPSPRHEACRALSAAAAAQWVNNLSPVRGKILSYRRGAAEWRGAAPSGTGVCPVDSFCLYCTSSTCESTSRLRVLTPISCTLGVVPDWYKDFPV